MLKARKTSGLPRGPTSHSQVSNPSPHPYHLLQGAVSDVRRFDVVLTPGPAAGETGRPPRTELP